MRLKTIVCDLKFHILSTEGKREEGRCFNCNNYILKWLGALVTMKSREESDLSSTEEGRCFDYSPTTTTYNPYIPIILYMLDLTCSGDVSPKWLDSQFSLQTAPGDSDAHLFFPGANSFLWLHECIGLLLKANSQLCMYVHVHRYKYI